MSQISQVLNNLLSFSDTNRLFNFDWKSYLILEELTYEDFSS